MSTTMNTSLLRPPRDIRMLLLKWIVALIIPVLVFTFVWNGDLIINSVLLGLFFGKGGDTPTVIQAAVFIALFYLTIIALAGYLVAADSGRRGILGMIGVWIDVIIFAVVPILCVQFLGNLVIGLALCVIIWPVYFYVRGCLLEGRRGRIKLLINVLRLVLGGLVLVLLGFGISISKIYLITIISLVLFAGLLSFDYLFVRARLRKVLRSIESPSQTEPPPLENLQVISDEQRPILMSRAKAGAFWFATVFAVIWLVVDIIFYFSGGLSLALLIWGIARTIILPIIGYFLGQLSGLIALRRVITPKGNGNGNGRKGLGGRANKLRELETLSTTRASEEAKDLVPNDLPLRSTGAQRFYLLLIAAFVLFYPILDPYLFGSGTVGRLTGYGDAGFYVILALGLNIVVGFAGLLDLGYVAFFAIGSYAWGMIGSTQFTELTGIAINPNLWPMLFWPMLLGAALIAAFFGVILGAPTLRLRGDYLAIVTLGFGEIIPIFFLELDRYTNGTNGIVGVYPPSLFPSADYLVSVIPGLPHFFLELVRSLNGVDWSSPTPFYYLILALITLSIFANVRLRDSRLGRAWIAIREDEIAAASSGVNLVNTKLFAFGAGAFFSGIAGAYHAAKLGGVSPDNFSFGDSIIYLAMVVIGGIGSIPGVIVGALAVYAINLFILAQLDTLAADPANFMFSIKNAIVQIIPGFTFGNIRNLVFGIILVIIMVFRPEGLIPSTRRRRELHRAADEAVEVGSLDVAPGAPGFESEVRVE